MKILESWNIGENFVIAKVDEFPKEIIQEQAKKFLGPDYPMLPRNLGTSPESAEKLKRLKNNLKSQYGLRLVLLKDQNIIGWTDGWQDSVEQDSFLMGASIVLPEYRKQGLYTALVKKVLELTQHEGFQSIWSLHIMTNNPVIIAKLKMDFHIYGFEVNTRYGALIRLIYHHNEMKRKALRFRAGAVGETEIRDLLLPKA